jgi:outer membrane protein insertion porin family
MLSLCVCVLFSILANAKKSPDVSANKISQVIIEGLKNAKYKEVLSEMSLKKGKFYSKEVARDDVGSIVGLDFFEDCTFSFNENTGILKFSVVEKPYIEDIIFRGNFEFSKNKLKSTISLKEKEFYDVLKMEESKKAVMKLYGDKGYADLTIEIYPTIDVDTNKMTITFLITENNKVLIGGVEIEGVISYPKKKILKLMKKTKPKKVFKDESYQNDLAAIEAFYKNNGFMDYKLVTSTSSFDKNRTKVFFTLNISEGSRYKIGEVSFYGNVTLEDKKLKKMIKFKKGQLFNEQKIDETKQEIVEVYADNGYLQAQAIPEFHKSGVDIVNIDWNITENSIVYVGNIYIEGLESTKEKVIRRELLLKPENVFSRRKLIGSMQRIRNLGFIDGIEPNLIPTSVPNIVDLGIEVVEGKPGNINAGIGYSSIDEFLLTIGAMHMNLFGLGQHLDLSIEYGKKKVNWSASWTEPYIFDKNASLTLSVFDMIRKKDYANITNAYDEKRLGFSIGVGPRINPLISLMLGYRYEDVTLSKIEDSVKQKIEQASDLSKDKTTSIFTQVVYDSLDYRYDPTRGNRQSLSINVAGTWLGGEVDHIRTVVRSSWFFPVFWKFVFCTRMEAGAIASYGSMKNVPIYERFYTGGPESIRGYKYRTEVGPVDGGNYKAVVNFEYKCPLVAEKENSILVGALFYDIGGDWSSRGTIKWIGTGENNLRSSAGFELRIATPAFPIRIGWAYGFNHKEKEKPSDFYFSIGYPM